MALLIRSVHVLGSNRPAEERSDVLVQGDKISAIGDFPNKKAEEVIDGQGAYLAPGFIDVDTTSDHYLSLFSEPNQKDFLGQGVTTIIGGQCGSSLAPLTGGSLESIRKWVNTNSINVNWHTLSELLKYLEKKPLGVNFGTLIGHSTIRRGLMGEKFSDLTSDQMSTLGHIAENALKDGAMGMSFGLGYVHGRSASFKELRFLAEILKRKNSVFTAHLRKTGDEIMGGVGEIKKIWEETGVSMIISHLTPKKGAEKAYEQVLSEINTMPPSNFHFSVFPFPISTVPLYTFLPKWAQGNFETMNSLISDPKNAEKIIGDMESIDPKNFVVAEAQGNDVFAGKTLQNIMEMYSISNCKKALFKFMLSTKLRAVIHYKNLNSKLLTKALASPHSLIVSHSPSFGDKRGFSKSPRSTSTFPEFLRLSQKEKLMSLEDAVQKITSVPAKKFGLEGRGEVKEGNFADLVVFRGDEIKTVVVNGKIAWNNGNATKELSGRILRRKHA